jgi:hypothetical protein
MSNKSREELSLLSTPSYAILYQSSKNVSIISIISQTTSRIALSLLSIIPTPFFGEGLGRS